MSTAASVTNTHVSDSSGEGPVVPAPVSEGLEKLGRLGYAAKGVIYVVIGLLATQAAFFSGGRTSDTKGAIYEIASQPFGRVLLAIMSAGLAGYVCWRFIEAYRDPENHGRDAKGLVKRAGYVVSGIAYGTLAWLAGTIALGAGGSQESSGSEADWTATLMAFPFGQWLVALVGLAVIGVAFFNLKRAYTAKFMKKYRPPPLSPTARHIALWAGRGGLSARALTFFIIGGFLILAAYRANPNETRGLSGALQAVAAQPYGPWLLGVVALGMIAYGVHCFFNARYRRFSLTDE